MSIQLSNDDKQFFVIGPLAACNLCQIV